MPNHLHAIISFESEAPMKRTVANWKRWTATQLKINWQEGFFDHRLRDQANAIAKRDYILINPVRASLIKNANEWPYYYDKHQR